MIPSPYLFIFRDGYVKILGLMLMVCACYQTPLATVYLRVRDSKVSHYPLSATEIYRQLRSSASLTNTITLNVTIQNIYRIITH